MYSDRHKLFIFHCPVADPLVFGLRIICSVLIDDDYDSYAGASIASDCKDAAVVGESRMGNKDPSSPPLPDSKHNLLNIRDLRRNVRLLPGKQEGIGYPCAFNYNLRLVQKRLGHSSIRTTEVYAYVMVLALKLEWI